MTRRDCRCNTCLESENRRDAYLASMTRRQRFRRWLWLYSGQIWLMAALLVVVALLWWWVA